MDDIKLMDKRSYFIGDRIALTQILLLLFTGSVCYLIELTNFVNTSISLFWWLFPLILPITIIIIIAVKKESLYFNHHWSLSFLLFLTLWSSLTIYLGLLVDSFVGYGNAFWVSLFVAFFYVVGYALAKILRKMRNSLSDEGTAGLGVLFSIGIITLTFIFGIYIYNIGLSNFGFGNYYHSILVKIPNQTCMFGIYLIISGICIVI